MAAVLKELDAITARIKSDYRRCAIWRASMSSSQTPVSPLRAIHACTRAGYVGSRRIGQVPAIGAPGTEAIQRRQRRPESDECRVNSVKGGQVWRARGVGAGGSFDEEAPATGFDRDGRGDPAIERGTLAAVVEPFGVGSEQVRARLPPRQAPFGTADPALPA
jgi:hypothetical protein